MILYNNLDLIHNNYRIKLEFKNNIIIVGGDSGTGKSFLYDVLSLYSIKLEYQNIITFNREKISYPSFRLIDFLKKLKNSFIVIDNIDIILDDKSRNFINKDKNNQYLLLGRNTKGLSLNINSFARIEIEDNVIYFSYPYLRNVEIVKKYENVSGFDLKLP